MYYKKNSRFLLLTVNISSQGLVSTLNSIVSLQDPPQCLKSLFRVHRGRFLSYSKKVKLAKMTTRCHSLSFAVTLCHWLSLVVICCQSLSFVVIRCLSLYHLLSLVVPLVVIRFHLLSFVVTRCTTRCHSLSLDVSLVCLFVNDPCSYPKF